LEDGILEIEITLYHPKAVERVDIFSIGAKNKKRVSF